MRIIIDIDDRKIKVHGALVMQVRPELDKTDHQKLIFNPTLDTPGYVYEVAKDNPTFLHNFLPELNVFAGDKPPSDIEKKQNDKK